MARALHVIHDMCFDPKMRRQFFDLPGTFSSKTFDVEGDDFVRSLNGGVHFVTIPNTFDASVHIHDCGRQVMDIRRRAAYPISEVQILLGGISRSHVYDLIDRGELRRVKLGRRALIPASEIDRIIEASLPPDDDTS